MSFDHLHYVPIVKAKAGEFWALSHLKSATKAIITPVFELVPHDSKKHTFASDLEKKVVSLHKSWQRPFFFDVRHSAPKDSLPESSTLTTAFKQLRTHGLVAVPVTRLGYSQRFQEAVKQTIAQDSRGVMVRLTVGDLAIRDRLKTALNNLCVLLDVREQDVDLLIDYAYKKPEEYEDLIHLQELHFTKIPKIDSWRTITLASVSFPESIKDLPDAKWVKLDRIEWKSWDYMISSRTASRRPAYGDYGIRHPSLPGFGTPKPNLRYTLAESYLCRRDEAKHAAMKEICKSLIRRAEYMGAAFSEGDRVISETAAIVGSGHSGGGREWTQWCSNHHFEFVATQIQSLPSS
jgi:hypothetical protein